MATNADTNAETSSKFKADNINMPAPETRDDAFEKHHSTLQRRTVFVGDMEVCSNNEVTTSGEQWEKERNDLISEKNNALERVSELEEQLDAIISATNALSKLVKTSSTSTPFQRQDITSLEEEDMIIDRLAKTWRLEDTGISTLYSSCKTLKNNLTLTQEEADAAIEEMVIAKQEAQNAQASLREANEVISQLMMDNASLKQERKKLAREVRQFVHRTNQEKQSEIEQAVAFIAHEHSLSSVSFERNNTFATCDDDESLSSMSAFVSSPSKSIGEETAATVLIEDDASPLGDVLSRSLVKAGTSPQSKRSYKITVDSSKQIGIVLLPMPLNPEKVVAGPGQDDKSQSSNQNFIEKLVFRKVPKDVFIVMGFQDFDTCSERRPLLGARLVAVDSLSLEHGDWDLSGVVKTIRSRDGPVSLTFRNDCLEDSQVQYLNEKYGTNYSFSHGA